MLRRVVNRRRGAAAVEAAVVFPVLFLLLFGLIIGGLGVFRYQQVAGQAREATRWAAVHGADWAAETKQDPASSAQVSEQAVLPLTAGMDTTRLSVTVQWIDGTTGSAMSWDSASRTPTSTTADGTTVANRVRVTVTYQWFPEALLVGPLNLRSTSELPMSF